MSNLSSQNVQKFSPEVVKKSEIYAAQCKTARDAISPLIALDVPGAYAAFQHFVHVEQLLKYALEGDHPSYEQALERIQSSERSAPNDIILPSLLQLISHPEFQGSSTEDSTQEAQHSVTNNSSIKHRFECYVRALSSNMFELTREEERLHSADALHCEVFALPDSSKEIFDSLSNAYTTDEHNADGEIVTYKIINEPDFPHSMVTVNLDYEFFDSKTFQKGYTPIFESIDNFLLGENFNELISGIKKIQNFHEQGRAEWLIEKDDRVITQKEVVETISELFQMNHNPPAIFIARALSLAWHLYHYRKNLTLTSELSDQSLFSPPYDSHQFDRERDVPLAKQFGVISDGELSSTIGRCTGELKSSLKAYHVSATYIAHPGEDRYNHPLSLAASLLSDFAEKRDESLFIQVFDRIKRLLPKLESKEKFSLTRRIMPPEQYRLLMEYDLRSWPEWPRENREEHRERTRKLFKL